MKDNNLNSKELNFKLNTLMLQDFKGIERSVISSVGFSTWIRALLQNWRQGTVACKGRSDVSYSNKKPWKQKGTGRARAGSARSPLWRGGGVIFGPQARVRKLKVNKEVKRRVLNNMFLDLLENKKICYLDWDFEKPKTSATRKVLENLKLDSQKIVLLLNPTDVVSYAAFSNISNVRLVFFDQLNAFDLASGNILMFLKKDLDMFKDTVSQWI